MDKEREEKKRNVFTNIFTNILRLELSLVVSDRAGHFQYF